MSAWPDTLKERVEKYIREYGKVSLAAVFLFLCIVSLFGITLYVSPRNLVVSFLDIGQGDAILIQTPSGKNMIIDGGPSDIVLSKLGEKLSYFDNTIDVMVETHPDADHVTGLIPILENFVVKKIIVSPVLGKTGIFGDLAKHIDDEEAEVHTGAQGDTIDFHDGVTATILYPSKNYKEKKNDTNDASVSLVVQYGEETFLLTGDLPSVEEHNLLSAGVSKHITVYKAGHHGSKYSSSEQLLSFIEPEYSVISAGKDNKYGHPNSEALGRLERFSKEILSTIIRGTISFSTDGRLLEVETEK